jgi:NAD(P)-dependent dehydrogenase (short-subunit alcohol dehydrogenase family)
MTGFQGGVEEVEMRITVNACPGFITDLTKTWRAAGRGCGRTALRRFGEADEVLGRSSSRIHAASYISGQVLAVDGGLAL